MEGGSIRGYTVSAVVFLKFGRKTYFSSDASARPVESLPPPPVCVNFCNKFFAFFHFLSGTTRTSCHVNSGVYCISLFFALGLRYSSYRISSNRTPGFYCFVGSDDCLSAYYLWRGGGGSIRGNTVFF